MSIFQLLALLFALFMIYFIRVQSHKKILSSIELGMWYAIWIIFMVLALRPSILTGLVTLFHFTRIFDLLTVVAFMVLVSLITVNYFNIRSLHSKIERVIRHQAINDHVKNSNKKSKSKTNE